MGINKDEIRAQLQQALVAASSYGAYLADGSEYSGNFGASVTVDKLKDFHRRRLQVLVQANPDMLAFETIPNKLETQVLLTLLMCFWYYLQC